MATFRIEKDSMGEVRVPAKAYYGAQSQRAVENFPVSGQGMPMPVVHAVALVKWFRRWRFRLRAHHPEKWEPVFGNDHAHTQY